MTKPKTSSVRVYFFECRAGGSKSKDFWPTIKPFLSKKGSGGNSEILLSENDKIISDQKEVYEIFNNFIVNVPKILAVTLEYLVTLKQTPVLPKYLKIFPQTSLNSLSK